METMSQLTADELVHDKGLARRSLDLSSLDDIPEERALSGKSSEEKEITRLDSGLGEWDSESSRKTSFSSQGRLSPDFAMDKPLQKDSNDSGRGEMNKMNTNKDSAKRRRSGIDMVNGSNKVPVLANGNNGESPRPIVKTRLPRIPKSNRASGIWSRKISPAGIHYLKMEDEMEEIIRNGKLTLVPRKISDHIPAVPIHSVDRFEVMEWNENLGLEDEELQLYKTPICDIYELHRHRWEFFGKMDFRKMMILALDGDAWMNGMQKYELMKSLVSEKDQKKMEKMLKQGYSPEEIVEHFMEDAEKKTGTHSLAKKMEKLMDGKDLSEDEVLDLMKNELGADSKKKMEELLKQGHSPKEVMKMMMQTGKTQEEEARDTAETMKHIMTSKKKNIKMTQKEMQQMLDERLDDESKAKMQEMLKKGVPLKDVLEHFAKQCDPPEEQLTEMEKKMKQMTEGRELSNYQIYELMKEQMDAESRKKMEEMVKNGCPLEEVIEHFMKKGKTKEQAQNEKSEELRQKLEGQKDMSQEEIIDMLKSELSKEDKAQLEKMLKNGCSMQEVIDHFLNRGNESDSEEKTAFQARMEEMLDGKNLNEDEILALMRSQVDDETKAEIKAMLEKGYTKQDVINHLMKNIKTNEEKERESAKKLMSLFDDQDMSEEEKIGMLEKQLNNEDKAQMEEMLRRGCSIEEVIGHFMSRCESPDREKSDFAKNIEKMIQGKNLSVDDVLQLIEGQLDDESKQKMEEMLKKGYTKQDVINHFLKHAKTKEEQMRETADKIKALMNDENMSDQSKLEILRNQLSKEDLAQMEEMLKDGGSLEDVMQQMLKSKSTESLAETELSKIVHLMMGDKQLTNAEILNLIKDQIDEKAREEMENMLKKGFSEQEVIEHFLTHGKTLSEKQKETSEKLQSMLNDTNLSPEEAIGLLQNTLEGADKAQMEQMLKQGCSMEEVIAHFSNRGICNKEESELAIKVKKLSSGKGLSTDQILSLIEDQLSEDGKANMAEMLKKGYSKEDVINHFMNNGKTVKEEHKETARRLSLLIDVESMSNEEMVSLMKEQLSPTDKKLMEEMIKQGKSIKDIVKHFIERADIEPIESELAVRMKKLSSGRKLSSEEMVSLLKDQLGEESKKEMEKMLAQGASMEDVISHFMSHGKTVEEEQRAVADKLKNIMTSSMTEEEIKQVLSSELSTKDKQKMDELLKQGFSMDEVLDHFQNRGSEDEAKSELAKKIKKLSGGKKLSNEDMIELIKDQLSEEGKEKMEEMLKAGKSMKDVIDHFMTNGKTQEEEHREIGEKLSKLVKNRKLSKEELVDLMTKELGTADKAQMQEMLKNGCSVEEVFDLFMNRGTTPDLPQTELAKRVKKFSKGKLLAKKDILTLIKYQLTEDSKTKLETMLQKGYKIDDVIEHFLMKGKTSDEEHRELAAKLEKLIDVKSMSESKIIEIMNSVLGAFDKTQIEDMLRRGCSTPELVNLFCNRGKKSSQKTEFATRMGRLLDGKCLAPQDILDLMKENLDDESKESIGTLLDKGYTVQDVIEHLMKTGKTPEQKQKEVAEKMLQLLDSDMSEEQVLNMMRKQLGAAGCKEMEEMLKKGCTLSEILDSFMHKPSELDTKEEDTEFAKKIKQLMGDKTLDAQQMIELIKSELDPTSQLQLDEMIRCGCSNDEVIQHFMNRERNKKGQKRNEFGRKIYELTKGKKLTKKELICLMKNYLDEQSLAKMEEMLKKGYPIEDVIDYFLKTGKTPEQALREKAIQKEKQKKETAKKIHKMIEGNNLSNEEILAILKLQMGDEDRQQLEVMLKKGCSTQEIIDHFVNRDVSDEELNEKTLFEKKMEELMDGQDLSNEQILDLMKHELDNDSIAQMEQMLQKGYTKEDVIKYFMKHGDDRNDFVQEMKRLTGGDTDLSKEQILDIMKSKLGVMSQRKMEDMIREGYSAEEIIQHLMTHGKTQEQETSIFTRRMSILLEGPGKPLTDKEKVEKLKENLGKEAASMLEELLKNGFTAEHVLDLFLKHGNDVNSLVGDSFFIREIIFPDEPEDAKSHSNRDVFSVIDKEDAKAKISYMSPSGKTHIFGLFFEMVLDVVNGKGLTHREILDLMRFRMGAGYAKEFDELRKKGLTLQQIVDYFLKRDEETIAESRLVAKLKAEARVDSRVYLKREYSKEKWGVSLTYTFSKNHGLHLIMDDVVENGPAWESGVRKGDVIVTVNDWLIVLMDRPQVAAHLFQAGANIVKLGIQKTRGNSPDKYLGVY